MYNTVMKILFSPSESKEIGGIAENSTYMFDDSLKNKQKDILDKYMSFLSKASDKDLEKLFGLKNQKDIDLYKSIDIYNDPKLKAIERYSGVAFDYLNYSSLRKSEQKFIDDNMIIFSNLFGPIHAGYMIPNYKLKQGEKLGTLQIEKFYKEYFKDSLDAILENEFVIDLRANFYKKFYISKKCVTMKFIKNGKVISHWAKAYRGKFSKELAKNQPTNEQDFQKISFENLEIKEIIKSKNQNEYIFNILV